MILLANRLVQILVLGLVAGLIGPISPTLAREPITAASFAIDYPAPPEVGEVVIADALTGPGLVQASNCPTGRNGREFVPDGYRLRVTGRCYENSSNAVATYWIDSLNVPDGEISLEWRVTAGPERAVVILEFRGSDDPGSGYFALIDPQSGVGVVRKRTSQSILTLARAELAPGTLKLDDWNRLTVRLRGPDIWLIVNDRVLLAARDDQYTEGTAQLTLFRRGNPDDVDEVSVVLRNLRISALAETVEARRPGLVTIPTASQEPVGQPWIGDIKFGSDRSGTNAVPSGGRVPFDTKDVYVFFSWRNIPAGARIGVEYRAGGETYYKDEFAPEWANGNSRDVMFSGHASGGTGPVNYELPKFEIILYLDGHEVARGWIEPG